MVEGFCAVYADSKHVILPLWFSSYPFSLQSYLSVPAVQFWLFNFLILIILHFSLFIWLSICHNFYLLCNLIEFKFIEFTYRSGVKNSLFLKKIHVKLTLPCDSPNYYVFFICIHWDFFFSIFCVSLRFIFFFLYHILFTLIFYFSSLSCLFLLPWVRTCISSFSSFILFFTSTQGRIHPEQPCFLWPRPPTTLLLP